MRIYRSILIILILIYPLIVGSSYGQIVVHSEANGVIREEIVTGLNNAETHISFGAPVQRGSLGTVKFRGEVLRGGEDEVNQIISFYHFAIKVTEILEDRSGRISVGSIVGVTSHRSGSARVDASYNGDFVEVYGKYTLETRGMPYYSYASNVELSESFGDGSQYYLIKYQIVPPRPSQTCSVWTDKNEYNIGDKIDVYYSVNKDCTAKLTIILPNGQTTVLGGPNAVPASTRSKQAFAGEPCGKRRVVFETWSSSSASGSPSCRSEWDFTVRCRETCSGTVQVVVYDSITNSPLSGARVSISPSGSSGYTRDGLFIVTGQCPNKAQTVTVILDGYESATETVYTDINGNQIIGIPLKRAIQEERDRCTGVISGGVIDAEGGMPISGAFLRIYGQKIDWSGTTGAYGGFRSSQSFCRLSTYEIECNKIGYITKKMSIKTDENGNLVVTIPIKSEKPDCSGKISGHVFNANNKSPISGAALLICQDGGSCFPTPLVDSIGLYETGQNTCPSTTYQVTCSANGYKTVTTRVTTDAKGNAWKEFDLVPECSGKISGHVFNANNKSPISGAALLICQDGGSCFPTPLVDSIGLYETGQNTCPSTTYQVTCSANGYKTVTTRVTTDAKGNAWKEFDLEPECTGKISGHVFNANNKSPIPGAALLICSDGGSCFPTPLVDSIGLYETGQNTCPSTTYQVTCSANGYKTVTTRVTTDAKGNAWKEFDLVPECSGKISGHVYNADDKSLISGAALLICQDGGSCFPTPLVDSIGLYETGQNTCPSTTYQVTCSANGYRTVTTRVTTDAKGNAWKDFDLELIKKEGNRPPIIKEIMFAPKSPQPLGTINLLKGVGITIAVNAQDPDGDTLKYKFELKEEGGSFRTIKDWSTLPVCSSWKPNKEGEYTIRVSVKDIESETSKEDIYLITDKYYIIISDGIKEYEMGGVTEPVFYLGSAIHVKVYPQPTSEFTYILIHRKSGVQFGKSLVTSDASFYVDVPVQLPIGEYYILIEEVNIQSDPIYIIFNPYTVNGHEVDAFWRSDIIKKYDNFGRFNKNYYTHHFSNSVFKFAIEAADKFTGDISYEKYLGQETSILLIYKDLKVNEVLGTYMPTTDIQELIIKMSNNERIDVDCDIYSYIMISLLRSVGIPSRMVHGQWKTKLVFLEGHAWTEVYFADEGKWKVVDFGITDGGIPLIMDIGSEYVSMLGKEFHQNWNKGSDWHNMYDESGKNRKTDYS